MGEVNSFEDIMDGVFTGEEAALFALDDNTKPESFEAIMGRTLTTGAVVEINELMVAAENTTVAKVEMEWAFPYIAPGTALYSVGVAIEEAYLTRDWLVDESLDASSESYKLAVAEHDMTIRRREIFGRICKEISDEIKFNRDPEVRLELFRISVEGITDEIRDDVTQEAIASEVAEELIELVEHIGMLFEHGVNHHFQTV